MNSMSAETEMLRIHASNRLTNACEAEAIRRYLPQALHIDDAAWGTLPFSKDWQQAWSDGVPMREKEAEALRDRLSHTASTVAQAAADYTGTDVQAAADLGDAASDLSGVMPDAVARTASPGGDGFDVDFSGSPQAAELPEDLRPESGDKYDGKSLMDDFASQHKGTIEEAEGLLECGPVDFDLDEGLYKPSAYMAAVDNVDPNLIDAHAATLGKAARCYTSVKDDVEEGAAAVATTWTGGGAKAYSHYSGKTTGFVDDIHGEVAGMRERGEKAAAELDGLLDSMHHQATRDIKSVDGSRIERIRQAVDLVNDITAFSDKFGRSIELHDEIDRFTNNDKYGEGSAHRIQAQADKHNGGGRFDPRFTLGIPKNVINEAYRILCARMKYLSIAWQAAVDTTAEVELLPEGGNKAAEIGQSETDPVVEQSWSTASGAGAHGAGGGGAGGGSGGGAGASGSASTGGASAVPALDLENAADPTGDQGGPLPKELLEIDGSDEFAESVRAELDSIALTPQGRELLDELTVRLDAVPEHEGGPALLEFAESTDGDASHSLLDDADGKCLVVRIPADELGGPASESELEFQLREALNLLEPAKEEV